MKRILLPLLMTLGMSNAEVLHTSPKVHTYDANYELSDNVVRIATITFRANSATLNKDHLIIVIPARTNMAGFPIYRGVILGTTSNNGGHACPFPTIWMETFNIGGVANPNVECAEIVPNRKYTLTVHISKDWIAYSISDKNGVVSQNAMNATLRWGVDEERINKVTYPTFKKLNIGIVEDRESIVNIQNITTSYYLEN